MPHTIDIRAARTADLDFIRKVLNHEILHATSVYDETPRTASQMAQWWRQKQQRREPILLAWRQNQPLAYATYGAFRPWEGFRYTVEHSIYTTSEARGTGVGHALLEALITAARQQQIHCMMAGIDGENKGSYAFHARHGFKEVGRLPQVGRKFGRWLDLIFMQKML